MTTRYFGAPIKRNEDRRLLTGQALFVDDVEFANLLHTAFLRSAIAHGRVRGIDLGHTVTPSPLNPLGIKGAGEAGAIPVGPLFAQAIEDASARDAKGIELLEIPLSPGRSWQLVKKQLGRADHGPARDPRRAASDDWASARESAGCRQCRRRPTEYEQSTRSQCLRRAAPSRLQRRLESLSAIAGIHSDPPAMGNLGIV